jgi:DNA repair exonuclease SbcCD ATPase subunit
MEKLNELKNLSERKIGKKEQVEQEIAELTRNIRTNRKHGKNLTEAHEIIKIVGGETQQQIQYHISDITSLALESVFSNPYKLMMNFEERRGKIECDLLFERNGDIIKPKDAAGFGQMDIASLALRVAAWSMQSPRTRPTILIDEPFHWLSRNFHEEASQMVKTLSDKLGIQFIICTHIPELAECADKVFNVKLKSKVSQVKELK